MSKKDFEAIANCLNANIAPLALVQDFADMLAETNPRFDKRRFVEASTLTLIKIVEHDSYMLNVAHGNV